MRLSRGETSDEERVVQRWVDGRPPEIRGHLQSPIHTLLDELGEIVREYRRLTT